jgi:hypothetical protein
MTYNIKSQIYMQQLLISLDLKNSLFYSKPYLHDQLFNNYNKIIEH